MLAVLKTATGSALVHAVEIPAQVAVPKVISWGARAFLFHDASPAGAEFREVQAMRVVTDPYGMDPERA